ncbi:hypothetical protein KCP70_06080 [Salmonella enterica subsp. enterica]|nr:hypothetical protein KCP70_06080 [Salmonella enterica subsp. enterica]
MARFGERDLHNRRSSFRLLRRCSDRYAPGCANSFRHPQSRPCRKCWLRLASRYHNGTSCAVGINQQTCAAR